MANVTVETQRQRHPHPVKVLLTAKEGTCSETWEMLEKTLFTLHTLLNLDNWTKIKTADGIFVSYWTT